jgi:hypothetical protein
MSNTQTHLSVDPKYTFTCHVATPDGSPLTGLYIQAYDQDPATTHDPLGSTVTTDANGIARIQFRLSDFSVYPAEAGADIYFKVFRGNTVLEFSLSNSGNTETVLHQLQPGNTDIRFEIALSHVVTGQIVYENGLPAPNQTLKFLYQSGIYQLQQGTEDPKTFGKTLGETTTDSQGKYTFFYHSDRSINLQVCQVHQDDSQTLTPLLKRFKLNASPYEVLNLVVVGSFTSQESSEFEALRQALAKQQVKLIHLADLQETDDRSDITTLHQLTGWDARLITLAAMAVQLSQSHSKISVEAAYGLLRAGLPADPKRLAVIPTEAVVKAIKKANDANIISLSDDDVDSFKSNFNTFAQAIRLSTKAPGVLNSPDELITQAANLYPLYREQKEYFKTCYLKRHQTPLWEALTQTEDDSKRFTSDQIEELKLQGRLATLTRNNTSLIQDLVADQHLTSLDDLVLQLEETTGSGSEQKSYKYYEPEAWKACLTRLGKGDEEQIKALIPEAYEGDLDNYATAMAQKVQESFPLYVLSQQVRRNELSLGAAKDVTAQLLENLQRQGFKLGKTPFTPFVSSRETDLYTGISNPDHEIAKQGAQRLLNLAQIVPSTKALNSLLSAGFNSVRDVTRLSPKKFMKLYEDDFDAPQQAQQIYQKALGIAATTEQLVSGLRQEFQQLPMHGMPTAPTDTRKELIRAYPNLQFLFGTLDYADCDHSQSVLSPAAYFVELLRLLDPHEDDWARTIRRWHETHKDETGHALPYPLKSALSQSEQEHYSKWFETLPLLPGQRPTPLSPEWPPYSILVNRRPDLPHIELTPENTHTALPYIDVVNEILEYYVANGRLADQAAYNIDGATTEELLAEPQNVIAAAYETLKDTAYPLTLPFDLPLETVRALLNHFNIPLWHLLDTFCTKDALFAPQSTTTEDDSDADNDSNNTAYYRSAVHTEYLELSPSEYKLFTNAEVHQEWPKLYGLSSEETTATALHELGSAKMLAQRLGVSYTELTQLLQTQFINPHFAEIKPVWVLGMNPRELFQLLSSYETNEGALVQYISDVVLPKLQELWEHKQISDTRKQMMAEVVGFSVSQANSYFAETLDDLERYQFVNKLTTSLVNRFRQREGEVGFSRTLVLVDESAMSNFDETQIEFASGETIDAASLLKFNLFVRLWKKLDWPISEVDYALSTFFRPTVSENADDTDQIGAVSEGFRDTLVCLSHLQALNEKLDLGRDGRRKLLSLWRDIPTTGLDPLYADLFLNRSLLKEAPVFDEPVFGKHLQHFSEGIFQPFRWDPNTGTDENIAHGFVSLKGHLTAVQSALNLTTEEITEILELSDNSLENAALNLSTLSLLYRYKLLAKGLDLSVKELIIFKQVSGIEPFESLPSSSLDKSPSSVCQQTVAFVDLVNKIKATDFTAEDLNYLFRHEFDPSGKYQVDEAVFEALLETLSNGIQQIYAEYSVPADPDLITEEIVQNLIQLVLPPDVCDRFWGYWHNTATVNLHTETEISEVENQPQLNYEIYTFQKTIEVIGQDGQSRPVPVKISVEYEPDSLIKRIFYEGALIEDVDQILEDLGITAQTLEALKIKISEMTEEELFSYFRKLVDDVLKQASTQVEDQRKAFYKSYLDSWIGYDDLFKKEADDTSQKLVLKEFTEKILESVVQQRIDELVTRALSDDLEIDLDLLQFLKKILNSFTAVGKQASYAEFFKSPDASDNDKLIVHSLRDPMTIVPPAGFNSVQVQFCLQVPKTNDYRISINCENKGSTIELISRRFSGNPILSDTTTSNNSEILTESLNMFAKQDYSFELKATNLNQGKLRIRILRNNLPGDISQEVSITPQHPKAIADLLRLIDYVRLIKSSQIIQTLKLSGEELAYLQANQKKFGGFSFDQLPISLVNPDQAQKNISLFQNGLVYLIDYVQFRDKLKAQPEDLLRILTQAPKATQQSNAQKLFDDIGALMHRKPVVIGDAVQALGQKASDFEDVRELQRLWQALQLEVKVGVPSEKLASWTQIVCSDDFKERVKIASEAKNIIKSRYESRAWQQIAQPIFDTLRQRKRDALVAHILHQKNFASQEELFEYFLIDPGMEPVVQTSRLQLAISSVQLFIQRCLLNLEPLVSPEVIDSEQWNWMKRYRVWEANRKIFLYPENWLEPEFRQDKSHLCAELESNLLAGDLSNDLAEAEFYNYLNQFEQIARLEIVSIYFDEKADILHVLGRTVNDPHQFFYRYQNTQKIWTAWEPVNADISGDHVLLVQWQHRLHIVWLSFLFDADIKSDSATKPIAETTSNSIQAGAIKKMSVQLNWCEYTQGKWGNRRASEFSDSIELKFTHPKTGKISGIPVEDPPHKERFNVKVFDKKRNVFVYSTYGDNNKSDDKHGNKPLKIYVVRGVKKILTWELVERNKKEQKGPLEAEILPFQIEFELVDRYQPIQGNIISEPDTDYMQSIPYRKANTSVVDRTLEPSGNQYLSDYGIWISFRDANSSEFDIEERKPVIQSKEKKGDSSIVLSSNFNVLSAADISDSGPFFYQQDDHAFLVEQKRTGPALQESEDFGINGLEDTIFEEEVEWQWEGRQLRDYQLQSEEYTIPQINEAVAIQPDIVQDWFFEKVIAYETAVADPSGKEIHVESSGRVIDFEQTRQKAIHQGYSWEEVYVPYQGKTTYRRRPAASNQYQAQDYHRFDDWD